MATPVYIKNFTATDGLTFNDPAGFEGWNSTAWQPFTTPAILITNIQAHQGYTANDDSSKHFFCDAGQYSANGKLARWSDNGGSYINDGVDNVDIFGDINGITGGTVNHLGGIDYFNDGGDGLIYIPFNRGGPTPTQNGIAIYNATTMVIVSATSTEAAGRQNAGISAYDSELWVCSFYETASTQVSVYEQAAPHNHIRDITFSGIDYPYDINGIKVNAAGIHVHGVYSSSYYRFSLTGEYEISFATNSNSTSNKGPEDLHIHGTELRLHYDTGTGGLSPTTRVNYYPYPVETTGTQSAEGFTMGATQGDTKSGGTILVKDPAASVVSTTMTWLYRVRPNRLYNNNYMTGFARSNTRFQSWVTSTGKLILQLSSGNRLESADAAMVVDDFTTVGFVWEESGTNLVDASLWINNVKVDSGLAIPVAGQNPPYGFGGITDLNNFGEGTFTDGAVYYEALSDSEMGDFEWPATGSPALITPYADLIYINGDSVSTNLNPNISGDTSLIVTWEPSIPSGMTETSGALGGAITTPTGTAIATVVGANSFGSVTDSFQVTTLTTGDPSTGINEPINKA
jgi:hypothetical protein